MKRVITNILLLVILMIFTGCNNIPTNVPDLNQTNIIKPPITVDNIPEPTPLETKYPNKGFNFNRL